jgi:aspartate kinase
MADKTPRKLIVVKYGGSVLDGGQAFQDAAAALKREHENGTNLIIVVSALKGVTDQLLTVASKISKETPPDVIDHVIGLGEEQSVRLMTSALKSKGVESVELTTDSPSWPIITDEKFGDAEPIIEECKASSELGVKSLLERRIVPVISGFVGRSPNGKITTLGRGGSDTTAIILAYCLNADEINLVKDVGGIYSADPKKVPEARQIRTITAWNASQLASNGGKFLHSKVFKYLSAKTRIRLLSINDPIGMGGSIIEGNIPRSVEIYPSPLTKIIVLGNFFQKPEVLGVVLKTVQEKERVVSIECTEKGLTLYVEGTSSDIILGIHSILKNEDSFQAISYEEDIASISIKGIETDNQKFRERVFDSLSSSGIEIKKYKCRQLFCKIYTRYEECEKASELIRMVFKEFENTKN